MTAFYELKNMVEPESESYMVIDEYPEIGYTLIYRNTSYQPWVVVWSYDKERGCWGQGYYFSKLEDATEFIRYRQGKIPCLRLEEIASKALDHIIELDPYDAEDWINEELEMNDMEKEYFCVEENLEEFKEDDK